MTGTGDGDGRQASRSIPAGPDAPRVARRFVAEQVPGHPRLDDIILATSELATNAVRHADGPLDRIEVEVHRDEAVHVAISQPGRFTDRREPADGLGGWGLRMMGALVDRWGIDDRSGVRAWFEVR